MTKENQIKLYNHYVELSEKDNGIKGKNAARYAQDILKGYPGLLGKSKTEDSKSKEKK